MKKIRLFDSFAGVGALHLALKRLGVETEVVGLSEIDINAMISYCGVHEFDYNNVEVPSIEEMKQYLIDRNIGFSFEKNKNSVSRMNHKRLELAYKCAVATKNFGDISKLDYSNLPDFDLFNFSFPCTDLSAAGKQRGLRNADGTHTRSGLVKFGIELIKAKKPKYVMIENVQALIHKKFIDDFYGIVNEIESYGYKCFYPTKKDKKGNLVPVCLNSKNFNVPQNRDRIFVICVREDSVKEFNFPTGKPVTKAIKDILESNVDEKYYLTNNNTKVLLEKIENGSIDKPNMDDTCLGRIKIAGKFEEGNFDSSKRVYDINGISPTLTCSTSSLPKIFENLTSSSDVLEKGQYRIRKLTPRECWRAMGFDDKSFDRAVAMGVSNHALYKQAGNSIVVDVLEAIFKNLL